MCNTMYEIKIMLNIMWPRKKLPRGHLKTLTRVPNDLCSLRTRMLEKKMYNKIETDDL